MKMYNNSNIQTVTEKAEKKKVVGGYDTNMSILKMSSWVTERQEPKFPKAGR